MSSSLTVLFYLSAFIATGYSLSCIECESRGRNSCTGSSRTCATNEVCASSLTRDTAAGTEETFRRTCEDSSFCGKSARLSIPTAKLTSSFTCCYSDECTPPIPTLMPNDTKKNGVTCTGCFSAGSDSCNGTALACTGDERWCFKTILSDPPLILQGCASSEACNLFGLVPKQERRNRNIEVSCTSGGSVLQHSLLLLLFVALFH